MNPARRHRTMPGFTLPEVMIGAAIVALLATLAVPGYQQYVLRTQRALARATLVDIAARLEVAALHQRRYPDDFEFYFRGMDGQGALTGVVEVGLDRTGRINADDLDDPDSLYSIRLTRAGTTFELRASARHAQARDTRCPVLVLSSTGLRSAPPHDDPDCWSR